MVGMLRSAARFIQPGIARLAGGAEAIGEAAGGGNKILNFLKDGYNTPAGRFAIGAVEDTGLGMMYGANPIEAGASALTGRAGAWAGSVLGHAVGKETGQGIGEFVGAVGGNMLGYNLPSMLGFDAGSHSNEQPGNPDSAQIDPMQQRQQELMASLSPEQVRKMQESAMKKAAVAQYQAQAMSAYGYNTPQYGGQGQ